LISAVLFLSSYTGADKVNTDKYNSEFQNSNNLYSRMGAQVKYC